MCLSNFATYLAEKKSANLDYSDGTAIEVLSVKSKASWTL